MNNKNYWNDVAKWGLLIGVVMSGSRLLEYGMMLTGSVTHFALLTVEWIVVAVLYVVLCYRAVLLKAKAAYETIGFSFGFCVNYALMISVFASIIVAALSYVYMNSVIGGYAIYMERLITSVTQVMTETQMEGSVADMYTEAFETIRNGEITEPSMFDTLLSTLSTYIFAGVLSGVVATFIVKRKLKKIFSRNEQ